MNLMKFKELLGTKAIATVGTKGDANGKSVTTSPCTIPTAVTSTALVLSITAKNSPLSVLCSERIRHHKF